jgi:BMFP domain-containing protein YqiC
MAGSVRHALHNQQSLNLAFSLKMQYVNFNMEPRSLNEFVKQFSDSLPTALKDLKGEFQEQFHAGLSYALQKFDLVTRQEFDVQVQLLLKLEAKVTKLEQKIAQFENLTSGPQDLQTT